MALIEKLTAIADAIRSKTGKTDGLTLDQMPGEIESIEIGGGSGGGDIDALIDKSITEVKSNVTVISDSVFNNCDALVSAEFPNATSIGDSAFKDCNVLVTAEFPNATSIGGSAFQMCKKLKATNFPLVTTIGTNAFFTCTSLKTAKFPLITTLTQGEFQNCWSLETADISSVTSIGRYVFYDCRSLKVVILRSEVMCPLGDTKSFSSCWLIEGGTGFFYVPKALVEEYQAATNWSTWATQFRALEDYTVDGTITGELDPEKI